MFFFFTLECMHVHTSSHVCVYLKEKGGGGHNGCIELNSSTHPTHDSFWFCSLRYSIVLTVSPAVGAECLMQILMTDRYQVKQLCIHTGGRRQLWANKRENNRQKRTSLSQVLAADKCKQLCLMDNTGTTPHLRSFSGTKKQDNKVLKHFRRANS